MHVQSEQRTSNAPPRWAIVVALLPMSISWVAMGLALVLPNGLTRYGLLFAAGLALLLGFGLTLVLSACYPDKQAEQRRPMGNAPTRVGAAAGSRHWQRAELHSGGTALGYDEQPVRAGKGSAQ